MGKGPLWATGCSSGPEDHMTPPASHRLPPAEPGPLVLPAQPSHPKAISEGWRLVGEGWKAAWPQPLLVGL